MLWCQHHLIGHGFLKWVAIVSKVDVHCTVLYSLFWYLNTFTHTLCFHSLTCTQDIFLKLAIVCPNLQALQPAWCFAARTKYGIACIMQVDRHSLFQLELSTISVSWLTCLCFYNGGQLSWLCWSLRTGFCQLSWLIDVCWFKFGNYQMLIEYIYCLAVGLFWVTLCNHSCNFEGNGAPRRHVWSVDLVVDMPSFIDWTKQRIIVTSSIE